MVPKTRAELLAAGYTVETVTLPLSETVDVQNDGKYGWQGGVYHWACRLCRAGEAGDLSWYEAGRRARLHLRDTHRATGDSDEYQPPIGERNQS